VSIIDILRSIHSSIHKKEILYSTFINRHRNTNAELFLEWNIRSYTHNLRKIKSSEVSKDKILSMNKYIILLYMSKKAILDTYFGLLCGIQCSGLTI